MHIVHGAPLPLDKGKQHLSSYIHNLKCGWDQNSRETVQNFISIEYCIINYAFYNPICNK